MRRCIAIVALAALPLACSGDDGSSGGGNGDGGPLDGDGAPRPDAAVVPPETPLTDRLSVATATAPNGVASGISNRRIWKSENLNIAPVFTVPLANCETLVGYTGQDGTARAMRLSEAGSLVETHELGTSLELRGFAAEPTGHFGALLWDDAGDKIYVRRFTPAGAEDWTEELTNPENIPDDFNIGGSRLEFGDGKYGAYYHVHSLSGHEGDTLKWVTTAGVESTGWAWGCSHQMSALLRYNDQDKKFMPACVTDCYPGTSGPSEDFDVNSIGGIYINHNDAKVMDVDAACNGNVAGELGGAAISPSGWTMVFNSHQNAATNGESSYNVSTMNQDIGFVSIGANYAPGSVVWLTSTSGTNEADSTVARWTPDEDTAEQYLVGWSEPGGTYAYRLARVSAAGATLEGPIDISSSAAWGRRTDPMRRHVDGDVVWSWFEAAGSTELHFARVDSGQESVCASF